MVIEIDLEINIADGIIPKMNKFNDAPLNVNDDLFKLFIHSSNYEEMLDEGREKYQVSILDVFKRTMTADDPRLELLSNEYFRLSQEDKYVQFISKVFELNEQEAYIDFSGTKNRIELINFIENKMRKLDKIDKLILINQVDVLNNDENDIYMINDLPILKVFIKGFLRETLWNSIVFRKYPLILVAGYDLSIHAIFKDNHDKTVYEKIANASNLYLR